MATKQNIQGILLLNKPIGITSNAALQKVKRLFRAKKAGHTGSLDPLATGMLPICFGEATKFSQFLLDSDKQYFVTMKLGIKTTTGDAEGEVISERPVNVTREQIEKVASEFLGPIQQIPPMFSAVKHQGKPLYELARKGIEIERAPRTVMIHSLELGEVRETEVSFSIHCSKGTYVRTLAEDMGEKLGCGAHVIGLHRIAVVPYQDKKMHTLADLEAIAHTELMSHLLPVETSLDSYPAVNLSTAAVFYLKTGQAVMAPHLPTQGFVRIYDNHQFLGVGEIMEDGKLAPRRLVTSNMAKA
jgi:tRNA pseudouridine55 synthase